MKWTTQQHIHYNILLLQFNHRLSFHWLENWMQNWNGIQCEWLLRWQEAELFRTAWHCFIRVFDSSVNRKTRYYSAHAYSERNGEKNSQMRQRNMIAKFISILANDKYSTSRPTCLQNELSKNFIRNSIMSHYFIQLVIYDAEPLAMFFFLEKFFAKFERDSQNMPENFSKSFSTLRNFAPLQTSR